MSSIIQNTVYFLGTIFFGFNILLEALFLWSLLGKKLHPNFGAVIVDVLSVNIATFVILLMTEGRYLLNIIPSITQFSSMKRAALIFPYGFVRIAVLMAIIDGIILYFYYTFARKRTDVKPLHIFGCGIGMNAPLLLFAGLILIFITLINEMFSYLNIK